MEDLRTSPSSPISPPYPLPRYGGKKIKKKIEA